MFNAEFYVKDDGSIPVEEFILSCNNKMKAKILRTICLLEEYGTNLRLPFSEHLGRGIFELIIKQSSDISRVLYFFYKDRRIILTNGFIKKNQKMPKDEFKLAMDRREHFLQREG